MIQETEYRPAFTRKSFDAMKFVDWDDPVVEPTLDEILADPIVRLVIDRDHLKFRDVERFLKSASERLYERDRSPNFGRVKLHQSAAAAF